MTAASIRGAALILAVMLGAGSVAAPLQAQTPAEPDCPFLSPGCDRLPRLFRDLERDLDREFAPLLRDLERNLNRDLAPLLDGLGRRVDPLLRDLGELLGDLSGWEAPEVLPNGDILIRRRPRPEAPPEQAPDQAPEGPVTAPFEL